MSVLTSVLRIGIGVSVSTRLEVMQSVQPIVVSLPALSFA